MPEYHHCLYTPILSLSPHTTPASLSRKKERMDLGHNTTFKKKTLENRSHDTQSQGKEQVKDSHNPGSGGFKRSCMGKSWDMGYFISQCDIPQPSLARFKLDLEVSDTYTRSDRRKASFVHAADNWMMGILSLNPIPRLTQADLEKSAGLWVSYFLFYGVIATWF